MENQQFYNLKNEQLQVLLTGHLGDGCLSKGKSNKFYNYLTNCKHLEYLEYKNKLLGELANKIFKVEHNGYSQTPIYVTSTSPNKNIDIIKNLSLEEVLYLMDELGFALWMYDDSSLHKDKYFYNINTQKYSYEDHVNILVPILKEKFNIIAKPTIERKIDGREFYYLRISKFEGSYNISKILQKYPVNCYKYKLWNSETIQDWSKLQAKLKSDGISVSNKRFSELLRIYQTKRDMQDIVRSLEKSKAGIVPLIK